MKKIRYTFAGFLLVLLASCQPEDFLDKTTVSDLTEANVFADSARTMDFLAGIYVDIGFSFHPDRFGSGGLDAASDEAEGKSQARATGYVQWVTASLTAANAQGSPWNLCYTNIRRVNLFLKHIDQAPFHPNQRARSKGEARFLRAWYYAMLLKHYGGIPLVGDTLYNAGDHITTKRNTYQECVNYILSECDAAEKDLPAEHLALDYGRITKGACKALKSRVLLYAASPLFNGEGIAEAAELKAITGYPNHDPQRWKEAADAAWSVMSSGFYQLHERDATSPGYGFADLFTRRKNSEYILAEMMPENAYLEGLWFPPSRGSLFPGAYPTQQLVDAFGMKNGLPITDPASGYDPDHPYLNRDPRLDNTVVRNGSKMMSDQTQQKETVYTYAGATPDGLGGGGTPTGYYVFKMIDQEITGGLFSTSERCLPLMRYAEVLLNFAEARNEFSGPDPDVYSAVEAIRKRAGLAPYALPLGLSKEEMRGIIRNERRLELAFEEHRFWDVRRWKIAEEVNERPVHGMQVIRQDDGSYTYQAFMVRDRNFRMPMYLWPIPLEEIIRSDELLQNPGW